MVAYENSACPHHGDIIEKLVRDRIPEIMKKNGAEAIFRIEKHFTIQREFFLQKFHEELEELKDAKNTEEIIEEAADLVELLRSFANHYGKTWNEVENVRRRKNKKRGGFKEFLIWRKPKEVSCVRCSSSTKD